MSLKYRGMNKNPKQKRKCHYCKGSGKMTKDHIVPKSRGGQNVGWNYVPACAECNNAKADDWPTCKCKLCLFSIDMHAMSGVTNDLHPQKSKSKSVPEV